MVHRRPISILMYAVLVLQLAVGTNWPAAHAANVLQQSHVGAMSMAHCPEHASLAHNTEEQDHQNAQADGPVSPSSRLPGPLPKHDCCRSACCQCHSSFTPAVTGTTDLPFFVALDWLVPALGARVSTARPDEFFRPPIA